MTHQEAVVFVVRLDGSAEGLEGLVLDGGEDRSIESSLVSF